MIAIVDAARNVAAWEQWATLLLGTEPKKWSGKDNLNLVPGSVMVNGVSDVGAVLREMALARLVVDLAGHGFLNSETERIWTGQQGNAVARWLIEHNRNGVEHAVTRARSESLELIIAGGTVYHWPGYAAFAAGNEAESRGTVGGSIEVRAAGVETVKGVLRHFTGLSGPTVRVHYELESVAPYPVQTWFGDEARFMSAALWEYYNDQEAAK